MSRLPQAFYAVGACTAAQRLLGQKLVRFVDGQRVAGIIVETEAYCDGAEPDLACHGTANGGRPTARNAVMHGPPGFAYVYFTYGIHWMFNVVTGVADQPSAVLIRAVEPCEGESQMAERRAGRPRTQWTNGPAKVAAAYAIDGSHNGACLFDPHGVIWIEALPPISAETIRTGPRIGLGKRVPEPWFSMPWRYWIDGNRFVSR